MFWIGSLCSGCRQISNVAGGGAHSAGVTLTSKKQRYSVKESINFML
jgi:hypothetical protein